MAENIISKSEIEDNYIDIPEPKRIDAEQHIGKKLGKLTAIKILGIHPKRRVIMAEFKCDCGKSKIAAMTDVIRLHTTSCGCLVAMKHGEANSKKGPCTKEYGAWSGIRCKVSRLLKLNKISSKSDLICERWLDSTHGYINFLQDMGRAPRRSRFIRLVRIDKTKPYNKENCCWRDGDEKYNEKEKGNE